MCARHSIDGDSLIKMALLKTVLNADWFTWYSTKPPRILNRTGKRSRANFVCCGQNKRVHSLECLSAQG